MAESLGSICLVRDGDQPSIAYSVNGIERSFVITWEQAGQLQGRWTDEALRLSAQRDRNGPRRDEDGSEGISVPSDDVGPSEGDSEEVSE